ncbi:MAG TPA: NAD(P)-binding domain-containing protein [Firmicutes bacterium]|nr:NAD(P)-binding domain-containing protein [Bacillota bacterium]
MVRYRSQAIAVLGAGHGGQALAADLALSGHPVRLWNRTPARLEAIMTAGGIRLTGPRRSGFARLALVTTDLSQAIRGVRLILVATPATAHASLARQLAPSLVDGQIIVLCPGRTLGALETIRVLRAAGLKADVTVAECSTFLFASRTVAPGQSVIHSVKKQVAVAALPVERTPLVVELLRRLYPCFHPAADTLETGMGNIGMLFHPAPVLCNLARVESGVVFDHYTEGISPAVARLLEALDAERLAVARRLRLKLPSAREWLARTYGAAGENLHEALQHHPGYKDIRAPQSLDTRYLWEDVPCGLVPLVSLGKEYGVPTPVAESLVRLASAITGVDFYAHGRTLTRMGLSGLTVDQLRAVARNGELPQKHLPYVAGLPLPLSEAVQ